MGRFSRHCSEIVRIAVIPIFELTNPFAISSRLLIWFCATRTKRADDSPTNGDLRQNGNTCDLIFDMSSLIKSGCWKPRPTKCWRSWRAADCAGACSVSQRARARFSADYRSAYRRRRKGRTSASRSAHTPLMSSRIPAQSRRALPY